MHCEKCVYNINSRETYPCSLCQEDGSFFEAESTEKSENSFTDNFNIKMFNEVDSYEHFHTR